MRPTLYVCNENGIPVRIPYGAAGTRCSAGQKNGVSPIIYIFRID